MFNPHGDYTLEFQKAVDQLFEQLKYCKKNSIHIPTLDERNQTVEQLTETYIHEIGKRPPSYQMTRLADYILCEILSDNKRNKSQTEEYPFLSEQQYLRRVRKETAFEFYEGNLNGDGADMTPPLRKNNRQSYRDYFRRENGIQ